MTNLNLGATGENYECCSDNTICQRVGSMQSCEAKFSYPVYESSSSCASPLVAGQFGFTGEFSAQSEAFRTEFSVVAVDVIASALSVYTVQPCLASSESRNGALTFTIDFVNARGAPAPPTGVLDNMRQTLLEFGWTAAVAKIGLGPQQGYTTTFFSVDGSSIDGPTCLGLCVSSNPAFENDVLCFCDDMCQFTDDCCPSKADVCPASL
jgi:hypothetical protein